MAFKTAALGVQERELVKGFEKEILATLQTCRDRIAGGRATTQLERWFGDASNDFAREVKEKVAKMRSHLLHTNVTCQMGLGEAPDTNAMADHFTVGFVGVSSLVAVTKASTEADVFSRIRIGPNFKNLAPHAPTAVASFHDQDQFQTLVHELSHVVLGTKDVRNQDGLTAYGGTRARRLVKESRSRAKKNAENWGLFVEEFR